MIFNESHRKPRGLIENYKYLLTFDGNYIAISHSFRDIVYELAGM